MHPRWANKPQVACRHLLTAHHRTYPHVISNDVSPGCEPISIHSAKSARRKRQLLKTNGLHFKTLPPALGLGRVRLRSKTVILCFIQIWILCCDHDFHLLHTTDLPLPPLQLLPPLPLLPTPPYHCCPLTTVAPPPLPLLPPPSYHCCPLPLTTVAPSLLPLLPPPSYHCCPLPLTTVVPSPLPLLPPYHCCPLPLTTVVPSPLLSPYHCCPLTTVVPSPLPLLPPPPYHCCPLTTVDIVYIYMLQVDVILVN